MLLLSLAVSRLAPLLLLASVFLVAGRLLYDRLNSSSRALAATAFGGVLVLGGLLLAPFALSGAWLVLAEKAFLDGRWEAAARNFARHDSRSAIRDPGRVRRRAVALMNTGGWAEASRVLEEFVATRGEVALGGDPDLLLSFGICRYYAGRIEESARLLGSVRSKRPEVIYLTSYLLGRAAEKSGAAGEAARLYEQAWRNYPGFFPAAYQAARVALRSGDVEAAVKVIRRFRSLSAEGANDPGLVRLEAAVRQGLAAMPEKEFVLVPR